MVHVVGGARGGGWAEAREKDQQLILLFNTDKLLYENSEATSDKTLLFWSLLPEADVKFSHNTSQQPTLPAGVSSVSDTTSALLWPRQALAL